jgi:hypothetical protein
MFYLRGNCYELLFRKISLDFYEFTIITLNFSFTVIAILVGIVIIIGISIGIGGIGGIGGISGISGVGISIRIRFALAFTLSLSLGFIGVFHRIHFLSVVEILFKSVTLFSRCSLDSLSML